MIKDNNTNININEQPSEILSAVQLIKLDPSYYFQLHPLFQKNIIIASEAVKADPQIYIKMTDLELKKNPNIILIALSYSQNKSIISTNIDMEIFKKETPNFILECINKDSNIFKRIINDSYFTQNTNGMIKISNILHQSIYLNPEIFLSFLVLQKDKSTHHQDNLTQNHMIRNLTFAYLEAIENTNILNVIDHDTISYMNNVESCEHRNKVLKKSVEKLLKLLPESVKNNIYAKEISKIFPNVFQVLPLRESTNIVNIPTI